MKNIIMILFVSFAVLICNTSFTKEQAEPMADKGENSFEFAFIGDTPYGVKPGENDTIFDSLTDEINSLTQLKWVLHAGDIKSGKSFCSDEMFLDRLKRFNTFEKPVIYTPGDNEWTDCHRRAAGAFHPLERLNKLRSIFFSTPGQSLGKQKFFLETQASDPSFAEFPENVRWIEKNIVFFTLHIVGSQNGLQDSEKHKSLKRGAEIEAEVQRRSSAAIVWMKSSFAKAKQLNSPGIFLMIHANMGFDNNDSDHKGFQAILESLEDTVRNFSKPVLLAHGDTHEFRFDTPTIFSASPPVNFFRVEAFGPQEGGWVRIKVNPDSKTVFEIIEELI